MIKLINIITQIIIILGCCAILIFTLSIAIAFTKGDFATINVSPRIISKGNAMESFGIWKDQFEDASQENQLEYNRFYLNLLSNINQIYCPQY